MSWAEDMNMDVYDEDEFARRRQLSLNTDTETLREYWMTRDDQKIFIEYMETSHIENILRAHYSDRLDLKEKTEKRFLLELSFRRRQEPPELEELPF